ncbi:MAG: hypothetical protein ACQEQH_03395 [Bacillota bacterium]
MSTNKFLKINVLIFTAVILINAVSYNFLNENISLIFSYKPSGEIRSNVPKTIGILFIPLISIFTIGVGFFQNLSKRLKHITYINVLLSLVNLVIILFNLL